MQSWNEGGKTGGGVVVEKRPGFGMEGVPKVPTPAFLPVPAALEGRTLGKETERNRPH